MPFPDNIGPRTQHAWTAILNLLADGHWHTHTDLRDEAHYASDLAGKSIDELIRKGYRTRHYTRRTSNLPGQGKVEAAVYRISDRGQAALDAMEVGRCSR